MSKSNQNLNVEQIIKSSPVALTTQEILFRRSPDLQQAIPEEIEIHTSKLLKLLTRLYNKGFLKKTRINNGELVWTDTQKKLEDDPRLDYFILPLKEVFKKYGQSKKAV